MSSNIVPGFIEATWPAPKHIRAFFSTRQGGVSNAPYASLNIAQHVGDAREHVNENRAILKQQLHLPSEPAWLQQVHGVQVVDLDKPTMSNEGDASITRKLDRVCTVMTADCLPLLMCNTSGTVVGAAHAGWRGLHAGVIEETVNALDQDPADVLVWLGPAIGPRAFEVGNEVKQAFEQHDSRATSAFTPSKPGHWFADIYALAKQRLQSMGIDRIYGGEFCTFNDEEQFYSYRRDGKTGRMASLIWIAGDQ